jgi:ubiquinone/menaquinone biosynthesis C-methylase UbiE
MNPSVAKWDFAASLFDRVSTGFEYRYRKFKRDFFGKSRGRTLLVAVGTGNDLHCFPERQPVVGIDFSGKMLEKAKTKLPGLPNRVDLIRADVETLPFPSDCFDTVVTSCTFCSVPHPVRGLKELRRVLKPDGQLLMFEHVRSGNFFLGLMLDAMTLLTRKLGPDMNRRTGENIRKAGLRLTGEFNLYLDVVKSFEAVKPYP